jgi:hypothetical protein
MRNLNLYFKNLIKFSSVNEIEQSDENNTFNFSFGNKNNNK